MDFGSTCTYFGVVIPGQKPMNEFTNSCQAYDADGDSNFWRFIGRDPLGTKSGSGQMIFYQEQANSWVFLEKGMVIGSNLIIMLQTL